MKQPNEKDDMQWQNAADAELNSSEWFGAIIRYLWHFGRREFNSFYNQKELKKNALIGYLFKIVLLIGLVAVVFLYPAAWPSQWTV